MKGYVDLSPFYGILLTSVSLVYFRFMVSIFLQILPYMLKPITTKGK